MYLCMRIKKNNFIYRLGCRIRGGRCTALAGPPVFSINSTRSSTAANHRNRLMAIAARVKIRSTWKPLLMNTMPWPPILPYLMSSIQLAHYSPFIQRHRCQSPILEQVSTIRQSAMQQSATPDWTHHADLSRLLSNRNKIIQRKPLRLFRYPAARLMTMTTKTC